MGAYLTHCSAACLIPCIGNLHQPEKRSWNIPLYKNSIINLTRPLQADIQAVFAFLFINIEAIIIFVHIHLCVHVSISVGGEDEDQGWHFPTPLRSAESLLQQTSLCPTARTSQPVLRAASASEGDPYGTQLSLFSFCLPAKVTLCCSQYCVFLLVHYSRLLIFCQKLQLPYSWPRHLPKLSDYDHQSHCCLSLSRAWPLIRATKQVNTDLKKLIIILPIFLYIIFLILCFFYF